MVSMAHPPITSWGSVEWAIGKSNTWTFMEKIDINRIPPLSPHIQSGWAPTLGILPPCHRSNPQLLDLWAGQLQLQTYFRAPLFGGRILLKLWHKDLVKPSNCWAQRKWSGHSLLQRDLCRNRRECRRSSYPGLHRIVASLPQSLPRLKNCSSKIYTENTWLKMEHIFGKNMHIPRRRRQAGEWAGVPSLQTWESLTFFRCAKFGWEMIHLDPVTALMGKSETL